MNQQPAAYTIVGYVYDKVLVQCPTTGQKIYMTVGQDGKPVEQPTFKAESAASKARFASAVAYNRAQWARDGRNSANRGAA